MTRYQWTRLGILGALAVAAALMTSAPSALASTVAPMTVTEMADYAGQVLIGEVTAVRAYWADNPRRIESEVTFDSVDYLKAAPADKSAPFTLIVPGGQVGDMQMRLCCAPQFAVGDKWLLFVLPTYKTFPVVGLYRGAFAIRPDDAGIERVYYARHGELSAVTGIAPDGMVQESMPTAHHDPNEHLHSGHNVNITAQTKAAPAEALTAQAFIDQLRPVLAASKEYQLTEPAGRRIVVQPPTTTLKMSRAQQARDAATSDKSGPPPGIRAHRPPIEVNDSGRPTASNGKEGDR